MRRLLGVVGSPRKGGNTHLLVSQVLAGAESAGASGDLVLLGDRQIRSCDGCHACWRGNLCVHRDGMGDLYPLLEACDVLVLGTPVYWYGPTALMKGFVDRLVYYNGPNRQGLLRGKEVLVVLPFEETDLEVGRFVLAFFRRCLDYLGMTLRGALLAPGLGPRGAALRRSELMEEACAEGIRAAGV